MSTSAISTPSGAEGVVETTPLLTVARQRYNVHSVAESSASTEYTPESDMVDITKDRYDLSTFKGRLQHFATVTSPLTLLASNAELKSAQELVKAYEAKFPANRTTGTYFVPRSEAQKFWKAKQLVDSSVHPDTGEVILLPFRMAAFVPTNLLVVGGMLMPNPSLAGIVFWQWVNQSLNVAVNYSNANKSVPMNMKEVGLAYAAATTSAVGIAVGMSRGVPKLKVSPGVKGVLTSLVPFVSVASAGIVNISCMRWKEIKDGVGVYIRDQEGNRHHIGDSSKAGQRAVAMTAASRVLTNSKSLPLSSPFSKQSDVAFFSGLTFPPRTLRLPPFSYFFLGFVVDSSNPDLASLGIEVPPTRQIHPGFRPTHTSRRPHIDRYKSPRLPPSRDCNLPPSRQNQPQPTRIQVPPPFRSTGKPHQRSRIQQGSLTNLDKPSLRTFVGNLLFCSTAQSHAAIDLAIFLQRLSQEQTQSMAARDNGSRCLRMIH